MAVLVIVIPEELVAEDAGVLDGPEPPGERRAVFQCFKLRLRIRVIVGHVRPGMRLVNAERGEQASDSIRGHRRAAVGVDSSGRGPAVGLYRALDELLREGAVFLRPDLPSGDFPGEDIDDNVQEKPCAAGRSFQFGDVPGPYLVRAMSHQLGFLFRRVSGLGAPLAGLAALAQQPVHGGLRAQVGALIQQDRPCLAW